MKIDDPTRAARERKRREAARARRRDAARDRMEGNIIDREIRGMIGERAERDRVERWKLAGSCALCGVELRTALDYQGRPVGPTPTARALPGRRLLGTERDPLVTTCPPCSKLLDQYDRKPDQWTRALAARLAAVRRSWLPDGFEVKPWHFAAVSWAGSVFAARANGDADPTPPAEPFGYLPAGWGDLDLPLDPEPTEPRTPPTDPRHIIDACVVCGSTDQLDDVHRRLDARWFGLDGQPIRGRVCAGCAGILFGPGGPVFYRSGPDYGLFAGVAVAVKTRIARTRPDAWPLTPSDEFLALASLPPFTFAGAVIHAREAGDPEPAAGVPFGWLT